MRVYMLTIENPITEEVKVRAVYSQKINAMKAYKELERIFTDKKDPLGLLLSVCDCHPNQDFEYVPSKTLISVGI